MSSDRDPQVGAAIRATAVPDREPDFMAGLDARLEAADAERDAAPSAAGPVGVTVPLHRRRRLVVAAAVAAAAVAAVFAIMLLGPGREAAHNGGLPQPMAPLGGPEPATAKQVIRASLQATRSAAFLRGIMTAGTMRRGRFVSTVSEDFLVSSAGSYRLSVRGLGGVGRGFPFPYALGWLATTTTGRVRGIQNTGTRSGSDVFHMPGSPATGILVQDMAAGQPYMSRFFPTDFPLSTLRSYMLQLLDAGPLVLRQVTVDGRACWVIVTTMASGGDGGGGQPVAYRVRIAVDRRTLFPVRFSSTGGGAVGQVRISYAGGGEPPAGAFVVAVPPGVHLTPTGPEFSVGPRGSSLGFKTIPFGDQTVMHDWIHDTPGFPTWMPDGFARTGATYSTTTLVGDSSGMHPEQDSCVVSLAYRRGFDAIYVGAEQNDQGHGFMEVNGRKYRTHFGDPFAQLYGPRWRYYRARTRDVVIRSGPFTGRVGHIVVDPSVLPHLWVRDPMFTATVSGDLSAADMVRVVESLASGVQVAAGDAAVK